MKLMTVYTPNGPRLYPDGYTGASTDCGSLWIYDQRGDSVAGYADGHWHFWAADGHLVEMVHTRRRLTEDEFNQLKGGA